MDKDLIREENEFNLEEDVATKDIEVENNKVVEVNEIGTEIVNDIEVDEKTGIIEDEDIDEGIDEGIDGDIDADTDDGEDTVEDSIENMENEIEDMFDKNTAEDVKDEIDLDNIIMEEVIYDAKGNPINSQVDGEMTLKYISLDEILVPPRGKIFVDDIGELEESIKLWGLVEPIHVVPYKDKYFLMHGYRRLLAYKNLGREVIPALVDTTRPKEVIRYLEVIANGTRKYNFLEMMLIGEFIEERQKSFSHDTIENILGLPSGHYLKSKYIDAAKHQFEDVYRKVVSGKMSVEQAFKKIEKELNKEEEMTPLDHLNSEGLPDYGEVEEEEYVQKTGERHPLDPALRKYVEGRDTHSCQCCGIGLGEPDLASIFQVHHIIPVKNGGPDKKGNLILLCPNCHSYAHAYEEGKFKPSKEMVETYDTIYNIILLGNIIKRGLPVDYELEAYDFYMERAKLYWLAE